MLRHTLRTFAVSLLFFFPLAAAAQCVSITTTGIAQTQNFDTLANTGTSSTLPTGWQILETGSSAAVNGLYAAGTGSGTAGDIYSFGPAGNTDRALGALRSGTLSPTIGACYTNNTGTAITSLDIAYTGEQWRLGTASRSDQLNFQYSSDATSLATGAWTGVAALNFTTPTTATIGAKDGNAAANRTALSSSVTALSIPNGATFWIRWTDVDASGADDGLAVDDFSLTAQGAVSLPQLTVNDVSMNEGNAGTTSFTFTVSLSAPAFAGGVTFDIATADGTAIAGSDYAAQSLTGQTIPAGSTSHTFTVLVSGELLPESNETFFVNVTGVTGANVIDNQGLGTIVNDDAAPNLTTNDVTLNEGDSGTTTFSFTISLSGPAPAGGVTFDIATANGTALAGSDYVAQSLVGLTIPAGNTTYTFDVIVNADTLGEQTETFVVNVSNVTNAIPVDNQGIGTISNDDAQRIHTVQGSGNTSPFSGQIVTVEGIVTAVHQGANSLNGFYIQEPDAQADADSLTSEGVFIYTNLAPAAVSVGQLVRVTGMVTEFGTAPHTLTEIVAPTVTVLSSGNSLPAYAIVTLPVATLGDLERFEGMRVQFAQTLTVSDHANLARFGELTLSANGRTLQPTNVVDPNDNPASGNTTSGNSNVAAVTAMVNLNSRSSIILDDGSTVSSPPVIPFLDPMTNTMRLGTTVSNLTGILSQSFGTHRLVADAPPPFNYAVRPATPPVVGGNVKIASMNVLNYFNGNGAGGGFPTSRGADSVLEFNRQRAKVIASAIGIGADVIGLMEIENDGNAATSSIQDLIDGMNGIAGPGAWAFITDPAFIGTDAIRSAIIYRTAAVAPVGGAISSADPVFNRPPIAQTLRLLSNNELFTLVVNHFKSKGGNGSGLDNDQGDGQAEFNNTRRLQAQTLLTFMGTLTATPRIITMGDFNAYEQEDPMDVMRAGGLASLINNSYSYHFAGQSGSLDHALGTAALMATVAGANKWHINADEPAILDYNVEGKNTTGCTSSCTSPDHFSTLPFRSSDHDPVLVGLQLVAAQTITFGAQGSQTYSTGGTFAVNPLASASSGLTVTYSTLTPAVCSVSGITVTILAAGTCTLAADQAGDGNFIAAQQVTQNIAIAQAGQTITFSPAIPLTVPANSWTVAATATSGLAVIFSSTTPALCSTSGNTVTILAIGTCIVAANQFGNTNYSAAPQVTQDILHTGTQAIAFAALPNLGLSNLPITLAATASSGLAVSFASQTVSVCTTTGINGSTLTLLKVGTCSVRATQAGNELYLAAAPVSQSFSVLLATSVVSLSSSANPAAYGDPVTLTAIVTGANPTGHVTFEANPAVGQTTVCKEVSLIGGVATCAVHGRYLKANPVFFRASYSGDAGNAAGTIVLQQQVTLVNATLSVSVNPVKPFAGHQMKLTALVTASTLGGTVTFSENGVALAGCANVTVASLPGARDSGVAICSIASAVAGHHDFVVTYRPANGAGFEQVILGVDVRSLPMHDYTGMWWGGLTENGWGMSITQHGDIQFIVLYVYDAAGKPTWYVLPTGTWNAAHTAYTGALYRPSGSLFSAYHGQSFKANKPVGTATVSYTGTDTATLTYTIDGISGTKNIQRQIFAADDGMPKLTVNDLWWGGDEQNGWGINIAQQGRVLFPVWYTYDAGGKTMWYAIPGGTWEGATYTGDLYATTSSPWLGTVYNAGSFTSVKIGKVVLTFIDQDNATMTYTVGDVTQTKNIVRQPY